MSRYLILNRETEGEDVVLGLLEKRDGGGFYLQWFGSSRLKMFKTIAEAMAQVRDAFGFPSAYLLKE